MAVKLPPALVIPDDVDAIQIVIPAGMSLWCSGYHVWSGHLDLETGEVVIDHEEGRDFDPPIKISKRTQE